MNRLTQCNYLAIITGVILGLLILTSCQSGSKDEGESTSGQESPLKIFPFSFENVPIGEIHPQWKIEATRSKGPLATWQVTEDPTAPTGQKVLALTDQNHDSGSTFNLCWTDDLSFQDGEISVSFKANTGEIDQGGGIIWRVQDKDNYYIARFNPLENNFRIYFVKDGIRRTLADAQVSLPAQKWHTLTIRQRGNQFEGLLNGKSLLKGENDVFSLAGGVGLWTKADAVTSFDTFVVIASDR